MKRASGLLLWILQLWAASVSLQAIDYTLDVALDTTSHIIEGKETITWSNHSKVPVADLRFHLYYNAWRNRKSSFLNSNRMLTRTFREWREGEWASIEVLRLVVERASGEKADLTSFQEFIQPDDGNPEDRTVMRVRLPGAVEPGETLTLHLDFRSKVPRPFARTGYRDSYFFIAQWFPKLGVLEPDGRWNCHQFIQTEFFSDYGLYDVRLRVPTHWLVGATGVEQEVEENGDGTATHHFRQERVHDFAWTTSPYFREYRRRFEHAGLKPVEMRLLLMPDHIGQQERYFRAASASLRYYGEWFGEYPYGHLTIIDPAYGSRSGGMEYPTLFTGGTRWLNPEGSNSPEGVTVHECGHQFWYGIIGNNEFEDAWLDEGFNTYSTRRVMMTAFPPTPVSRRYLDGMIPILFRGMEQAPRSVSGLGGYYGELKLDVMSTPSFRYGPAAGAVTGLPPGAGRVYGGGAYGVNSYTKPALMLVTLERYLGWKTFQKAMSTYFRRWQFRHPRPRDFFQVVDEVSGQDLSWFWKQTYYSSNIFDYAVDAVDSEAGDSSVLLRRWGEAIFPVPVRVRFSDGSTVTRRWDGRSRWMRYHFERDAVIEEVEVDPERILALDTNWTNNSYRRRSRAPFAARKWALKWMIWLQSLMETFAFFS